METQKTDWLGKLHQASELLFAERLHMEQLARAFRQVYQSEMASEISLTAQRLGEIEELVRTATGETLNEQIQFAGQSSAQLVKAALAGVLIAVKEQPDEPV